MRERENVVPAGASELAEPPVSHRTAEPKMASYRSSMAIDFKWSVELGWRVPILRSLQFKVNVRPGRVPCAGLLSLLRAGAAATPTPSRRQPQLDREGEKKP